MIIILIQNIEFRAGKNKGFKNILKNTMTAENELKNSKRLNLSILTDLVTTSNL
jgi:hypothetical protein